MANGLYLVLLVLVVELSHIQCKDVTDSKTGLRAQDLGCFADKEGDRAMGSVYFNARELIDWTRWPDMSHVVEICMREAANKSIKVFGIQFYGECWAAPDNPNNYNKYNKSKNCVAGLGAGLANEVYSIVTTCSSQGKEYPDKSNYFIPQNPVNPKKMGCQSCKCQMGVSTCTNFNCDYFAPCEKYSPAPPGQCCPVCKCIYKGRKYENGQSWANRGTAGKCFQCRCVNGQARCSSTACSADCPNPSYVPDQCCPTCRAGRPAKPTRIWETIPPTPAKPTWPSWGKKKRASTN